MVWCCLYVWSKVSWCCDLNCLQTTATHKKWLPALWTPWEPGVRQRAADIPLWSGELWHRWAALNGFPLLSVTLAFLWVFRGLPSQAVFAVVLGVFPLCPHHSCKDRGKCFHLGSSLTGWKGAFSPGALSLEQKLGLFPEIKMTVYVVIFFVVGKSWLCLFGFRAFTV